MIGFLVRGRLGLWLGLGLGLRSTLGFSAGAIVAEQMSDMSMISVLS